MTDDRPGDKRSRAWRLAAVVVLAALAIFQALLGVLDVAGVRGHFGWFQSPNEPTVVAHLGSGQSAERAGIKVGDVIDLDRLYPQRMVSFDPILAYAQMPGARVNVPVIRGSTRLTIPVTLGSAPSEPLPVAITSDLTTVIGTIVILLGGWLVIRRPSTMTWSLYAFLIGSTGYDPQTLDRFGWGVSLADNLLGALLGSAGAFLIVFAAIVPNDARSSWRDWFKRMAVGLAVVLFIVAAYPMIAWSIFGVPARYAFPPSWINNVAIAILYALTIVALSINYTHARGEERQRLKWIVLGLALAVGTSVVFQYIPVLTYFFWTRAWVSIVYSVGLVAIAYAIASGTIVDVRFAVSRAVVAAVLAGAIVVVFAIVDWLVSKNLQATRVGAIAEIGLAIALGFWFNALHRNVDTFVDRLFFRKRYEAERQLTAAAHAVLHCTSAEGIREVLVDETAVTLGLSSAALFEPLDGSTWSRTRDLGWTDGTLTTLGDDTLVRHIQAEQISLRISTMPWHPAGLPQANARPVLAVPVLARRRVVAIALYGPHTSGVDLDFDEVRAIERVAESAGAAYDHVEAETLRQRCDDLEETLAQLKLKYGSPSLSKQ